MRLSAIIRLPVFAEFVEWLVEPTGVDQGRKSPNRIRRFIDRDPDFVALYLDMTYPLFGCVLGGILERNLGRFLCFPCLLLLVQLKHLVNHVPTPPRMDVGVKLFCDSRVAGAEVVHIIIAIDKNVPLLLALDGIAILSWKLLGSHLFFCWRVDVVVGDMAKVNDILV